ncbi:MAG: hypothetical protein JWR21_1792 [Herminiimonas sp.]|nr:hypothetical protein [Herminiimonas sp.]
MAATFLTPKWLAGRLIALAVFEAKKTLYGTSVADGLKKATAFFKLDADTRLAVEGTSSGGIEKNITINKMFVNTGRLPGISHKNNTNFSNSMLGGCAVPVLLHRHRLRQIPRLVDIRAARQRRVIRQQLKRHDVEDGRQQTVVLRQPDNMHALAG